MGRGFRLVTRRFGAKMTCPRAHDLRHTALVRWRRETVGRHTYPAAKGPSYAVAAQSRKRRTRQHPPHSIGGEENAARGRRDGPTHFRSPRSSCGEEQNRRSLPHSLGGQGNCDLATSLRHAGQRGDSLGRHTQLVTRFSGEDMLRRPFGSKEFEKRNQIFHCGPSPGYGRHKGLAHREGSARSLAAATPRNPKCQTASPARTRGNFTPQRRVCPQRIAAAELRSGLCRYRA